MNSNFSKNLTSSMGISLGGLEVVTDFLFTNPEFYESDLVDVKNDMFSQKAVKHSYEKPVRPRKTKEAIMHKFSILQCNPVIQKDEVLESPTLVGDDTDFDFDFADEKPVAIEEIEDDSEILEANSLMQRLANMNNFSESIIEDNNNEDSTNDIEIDFEDDIESDFEDDIETDFEDDIESDFEDDIDSDFEDDIESDFEDDTTADMSFSDDELQILDSFENDFTPSTINAQSDSIDNIDDDIDIDENNEELDIDSDSDIDDDIDIDENNEELDIDSDSDIDDDSDEFEVEDISDTLDLELEDEIEELDKSSDCTNEKIKTSYKSKDSEELKQMKQRFAEMEKQLHELKNAKAKESASTIKDSVNKVNDTDDIDKLLGSSKNNKHTNCVDTYAQYSIMSIEALYKEVKDYMIKMGVKARAVEITVLNEKFGELNIRKLIQKSYLIKIGSKGVTVGR